MDKGAAEQQLPQMEGTKHAIKEAGEEPDEATAVRHGGIQAGQSDQQCQTQLPRW